MCLLSMIFWCLAFLFVASSSGSQENPTNDDIRNDKSMMRYDPVVSSVKYRNDERIQCDSHENSIENDNRVQHESSINTIKNNHKKDEESLRYKSHKYIVKNREQNQTYMSADVNSTEMNDSTQEIHVNLSKIEEKNDSTSNEFYRNSNTYIPIHNNNTVVIVPYEECNNVPCIQLCCPFGKYISIWGSCVTGQEKYYFPWVSVCGGDSNYKMNLNELFRLTVHDPCVIISRFGRVMHYFEEYEELNVNGSLYESSGNVILSTSYCLAVTYRTHNIYEVVVCTKLLYSEYPCDCLLISLPFLLLTFIVYSILPELRNMHSYILRAYVTSLFITYMITVLPYKISDIAATIYCFPLGYIFRFSFLSRFCWLNVMGFDMWSTFREFRSRQTNIKQIKKKFLMYSLYACGIPFILNVLCAIMDYIPGISESLRPEICRRFWFNEAKTISFYTPVFVVNIINICFFIDITLRILYRNIHTDHQMRDSESHCHNENKQRFTTYLKIFMMMEMIWGMELILWFAHINVLGVWIFVHAINNLQGLIIFIIFVCRKKIKKLLWKRFGFN